LYVKKNKHTILLFYSLDVGRYLADLGEANVDKKVLLTHSHRAWRFRPNWNVGMLWRRRS